MLAYFIVFILLLSSVYTIDVKGRIKGCSQREVFVVIVLILLAGLRNHVGADSISYEYSFYHETPLLSNLFSNKSFVELREPIWLLFMSFCKTIFGNFVSLQIIHAFILNFTLYRFYKKSSVGVLTALLLTFLTSWFTLNFEILRQSLCLAIFLDAVFLLKKKNYVWYVFLSILMFGIHNFSIVITTLVPFILFTKKEIAYSVLVLLIVLVIFFVDESVMNVFFSEANEFANDNMRDKITSYTHYNRYSYINLNFNGLLRLTLLSVLFPLSVLFLNKENKSSHLTDAHTNSRNKVLQAKELNKFILLYVLFGVLSAKLSIIFRLQQYMIPFVIAAIVNVIYSKEKKSWLTYAFLLLFSVFMIDTVVTLYKPTSYSDSFEPYNTRYFPYTSVFQEPDPLRERIWGK